MFLRRLAVAPWKVLAVVSALSVLALVSALSLAAGAPAAALADGPTTPILDDFNRPDENPLSGGGNWAQLFPNAVDLRLVNNGVELSASSGTRRRYWTPKTFGPDTEVHFQHNAAYNVGTIVFLHLRTTNVGSSSY